MTLCSNNILPQCQETPIYVESEVSISDAIGPPTLLQIPGHLLIHMLQRITEQDVAKVKVDRRSPVVIAGPIAQIFASDYRANSHYVEKSCDYPKMLTAMIYSE